MDNSARVLCSFVLALAATGVLGVDVGSLPNLQHGVSGTLEIISTTSMRIRNFRYDGQGPAAFLYYYPPGVPVDPRRATAQGIKVILPSPAGDSTGALRRGTRYTGQDLTFDLPAGADVCDISTITIWCEDFDVFFTELEIPTSTFANDGADPCALASDDDDSFSSGVDVGTLPNLQHGVGGTLEIISATSMRIRDFRYDGQGPAAFLYYYPPGVPVDPRRATAQGIKVILPSPAGDNTGALRRGTRYTGQDLTFDLPAGADVCDISTITIWCEDFDVFFTRLDIPTSTFANGRADPCALASGGDSSSSSTPSPPVKSGFENCALLDRSLQLSWTVDRDNEQISFMICGCQGSNPDVPQYMGFGLSGSNSFTNMEGADVTISWIDNDEGPMADDYHLRVGNRVQCRSGLGVCPDQLDNRGTCSSDVLDVSGFSGNRQQCVSFTRPFTTDDADCDLPFDPDNTEQYIVWGVGAIEETAFRHFTRSPSSSDPIHFGRDPQDDCEGVPITCELCEPFASTPMVPQENVFTARIGPSGNERGYMALTGQAGWGIAWYINDVLIPELYVERGQSYVFLVEGGDDPSDPSNYHPFYITSSISGGRLQNDESQRLEETVYAGFAAGDIPTATGRLCTLLESQEALAIREQCGNLVDYTQNLDHECRGGSPGTLTWTPDESTPDVVYYQCATHRNLGWKINVVDDLDTVRIQLVGFASSLAISSSLLTLLILALFGVYFSQH